MTKRLPARRLSTISRQLLSERHLVSGHGWLNPWGRRHACPHFGQQWVANASQALEGLAAASVVAIQMPAKTAARPTARLSVIGSPSSGAANSAATSGLTAMVLATRVGLARCRANTHRKKASAPPPAAR